MIEFRGVRKDFVDARGDRIAAVRDLSLTIERGETHCLIGTSGCGKTTTLRLVNRLEEPTLGQVLVGDEDVMQQDVHRLRRRIGYVIQTGGLFPHLTIAENVGLLPRLDRRERSWVRGRVEQLLQQVNLTPAKFADRYPAELSGGQRQRVGIARALALDPDYLLMDEPFGALDPITRAQIHDELRPLFDGLHKTVLLVTHDLDEAFRLAHRVSLMHRGSIVQTGTPDELCSQPANAFVAEFVQSRAGGAG